MEISFKEFTRDDTELLYKFNISENWKFYSGVRRTKENFLESIESDNYDGDENKSFWIINEEEEKIGFLKIEDLDDEIPVFDLRVLSKYRGKKVGERTLHWMNDYIFTNYSDIYRIEGCTREDNFPMRKVFKKCGYVKEAHYRKAWPANGSENYKEYYDSVMYGILRDDWEEKKTTPVNWNDDNF